MLGFLLDCVVSLATLGLRPSKRKRLGWRVGNAALLSYSLETKNSLEDRASQVSSGAFGVSDLF